jgi:hypothetical protein
MYNVPEDTDMMVTVRGRDVKYRPSEAGEVFGRPLTIKHGEKWSLRKGRGYMRTYAYIPMKRYDTL